jgi:hypothetical protein
MFEEEDRESENTINFLVEEKLSGDEEQELSGDEEQECKNTINSLVEENEKIDRHLWYLKYKLFDNGRKCSKEYGNFANVCRLLQSNHSFAVSYQTCCERADAYQERQVIEFLLQIDISGLKKLSIIVLLKSLRKTGQDFNAKRRVWERALEISKSSANPRDREQLTATHLRQAIDEILPQIKPEKKVLNPIQPKVVNDIIADRDLIATQIQPNFSSVGQTCRIHIPGFLCDRNHTTKNPEKIPHLPQYPTDAEDLEVRIIGGRIQKRNGEQNNWQPHNQGAKFYDGPMYEWKGLRFRSKAEVAIAFALDRMNVSYSPNIIVRINNPNKPDGRANVEVDFLVLYQGSQGILEVDGVFHTSERRVHEQERERLFKYGGIRVVERYDAKRCEREPYVVVQDFLKIMDAMHPNN